MGRVSACQVDARHHTGEGCLRSCLRSRALKEQEVAFEEVECRGVEGRFIGEGNNLNRPLVPTLPTPQSVPPLRHHLASWFMDTASRASDTGDTPSLRSTSEGARIALPARPETQPEPSRTRRLGLGLMLAFRLLCRGDSRPAPKDSGGSSFTFGARDYQGYPQLNLFQPFVAADTAHLHSNHHFPLNVSFSTLSLCNSSKSR